jgi:Glycosyl hydrolases family 16
MISRTLARRLTALGGTAALALALAPAAQADHAHPPGPVNAQTTFDWGKPIWQDDFVGPLKDIWRTKGPGLVRNQHGMLTLNTARTGTVSATLAGAGHEVGRWEIRLRSREYGRDHASYKVRTELVPAANRPQHCGARDVALNSYTLGGNRAHHYVRSLPARQSTAHTGVNLGNDRWHTFAVEVTKGRVSWFVDGHVISTENRAEAISSVPYTVKFTMLGEAGKRMNAARMQMDWLRYFTLRKANSKSVEATLPRSGTYAGAC